jgi:hypothetical protein
MQISIHNEQDLQQRIRQLERENDGMVIDKHPYKAKELI